MTARDKSRMLAGLLALALIGGAFRPARAAELDEIRDTQRKILERLDAQEKLLRDILNRIPAGPVRAAQPDPNRVYTIPVGGSPVRGPKNGRVTLVEFGDFQ